MLLPNNGSSTKSLRQSRTTTGSHILSTFNQMEILATSDVLEPTQDGGNYLDLMVLSLETSRTIKLLRSKELLMEKTRTSLLTMPTERSTNSGILCTLMSGRESHRKESSTKDSVFMSKETSMLSLSFKVEDTSI